MTSFNTLVSSTELAAHLDDPQWIILDCRHDLVNPSFGSDAYAAGHIPGARFISMDHDLADHAATVAGGRGRHPLPTPEALAATFSRLGIDAAKQVAVYDHAAGSYAARAWWCLRWLGHQTVAVLDGGIQQWEAEGKPLTTATPNWPAARFEAQPNRGMQVNAATVQARIGATDVCVIDARAPERYNGSTEPIDPVAGHIPGARNRFWKHNIGSDGRFKSAAQLRSEWQAALAGLAAAEVMHQCGSGVTACHNLLAMEVAGLSGATLYPGSWSEWCTDSARPVRTGDAP